MKTTLRGHIPFVGERLSNDDFQKLKNKRRDSRFNPDHEYIAEAVEEYLAAGGKIKIVVPDFKSSHPSNFITDLEDFLRG